MPQNLHESAAEVCMGAVMVDAETHFAAVEQQVPTPTLWPARYLSVWQAMTALHAVGKPLTPETVAAQSGFDVDVLMDWRIYAKNKPVDEAEVDANAVIVRELGTAAAARRIGATLAKADGIHPIATHIDTAQKALSDLTSITGKERPATAAAIGAEIEAELAGDVETGQLVPTGLGRLDDWTWSFNRTKVTVLGAPYKQRKTTLLRNIVLAAASRGSAVSVGMLESDRRTFAADCIAMIADQLLVENIIIGGNEDRMSGQWILNTRAWKQKGHVAKAVNRAIAIWKTLPITVYDREDVGFSPDPWMLRAKWRRDTLEYGTALCAIDYAQLLNFGSGMTSFDQAEASADYCKGAAADLNVHLIALAQLNEDGVSGTTSYSPKVKGGGALPAASDQTIRTSYDAEDSPTRLVAELKLGRGSRQGQKERYGIRPASGLITQFEFHNEAASVMLSSTLRGGEQLTLTAERGVS